MRTNKEERKKLMKLMKALDYLNVGLIENKKSDHDFGIECIKNWLQKNPMFFDDLYKEINRK